MSSQATPPVIVGSFSQNNKTSITIPLTAPVPAGAILWFGAGSGVVDTANVTVTDTQNNNYQIQSFNQLPGTGATILVAMVVGANALSISDTITLTCDVRANWTGCLGYTTGQQGYVLSETLQYNTTTTPTDNATGGPITVTGVAGFTLFAITAVLGPSSDSFTQDPNWGPDQVIKIQTTNVTIHMSTSIATDGPNTFQPVLGTARQSYILVASYS